MARIDIFSCEPFRAWNRLEARPRHAEFDKVLEAGVYDALWMLTRQWQFGEFQGEDTGSAIFSKIYMQTTAVTRLKTANGAAETYQDNIPLEKRIERMPFKADLKSRLDAAYLFLSALDNEAALPPQVAGYNRQLYKARLKQLFPLIDIAPIVNGETNEAIISKSKLLSNEDLTDTTHAYAGRYFDGFLLYTALKANLVTTTAAILVNAAEATMLANAITVFINWFENSYGEAIGANTAWLPDHLEYQFACALPGEDANNIILSANEYYSGDVDWFVFDSNKTETFDGLSGAATSAEMTNVKTQLLSVIPVEAKFAGAPNSRWWQFENGNVDLGNINAQTTDISKIVFTEYALLYNTDWLLVPYRVPVGSLCEIKGILVTDVFGQQFFVESALQGQTDNWAAWGMYNLSSVNPNGVRNVQVDTRLFIPPTVVKNMESEPVEEVHFVRDEMTNNIWAIEVQVPDELGSNRDGNSSAKNFTDYLKQFDITLPPNITDVNAMFKYTLANTVPENWIPFIPVHVKDSNRDIQLQRASMPRLFNDEFTHIRPLTQLLRTNIDDADNQSLPYFVNEEEVPRAGVQLSATFQRTRWYNGSIINWYGYRKTVGRGEGSSGLYYDRINLIKK